MSGRAARGGPSLPVDVGRLRTEFPELTDEELQAYVGVTALVLGDPATRAKAMREVMERAREAQQKGAEGGRLSENEQRLVRYLQALSKMQRSTVRREG